MNTAVPLLRGGRASKRHSNRPGFTFNSIWHSTRREGGPLPPVLPLQPSIGGGKNHVVIPGGNGITSESVFLTVNIVQNSQSSIDLKSLNLFATFNFLIPYCLVKNCFLTFNCLILYIMISVISLIYRVNIFLVMHDNWFIQDRVSLFKSYIGNIC